MNSQMILTNIALLKTQINNDKDYLDFFIPYVLSLLVDSSSDFIVDDESVRQRLREECGISIPNKIVHVLLRRITRDKRNILCKVDGKYQVVRENIDASMSFSRRREKVTNSLHDLALDFQSYYHSQTSRKLTEEDAFDAIEHFLSKYSVDALKLSVQGSIFPIPKTKGHDAIVAKYVLEIFRDSNRYYFDILKEMLAGNMLMNMLLTSDEIENPQSFKDVVFFLDTPLLMDLYGLNGEESQRSIEETIRLSTLVGGKIAVFEHTKDEFVALIRKYADKLSNSRYYAGNRLIQYAMKKNWKKADLVVMADKAKDFLLSKNIEIVEDPVYEADYIINETVLSNMLDDKSYSINERTKMNDIRSIQNIYFLRRKNEKRRIEDCVAIFVSNNRKLVKTAYEFHCQEADKGLSTMISDFHLANVAWMKSPSVSKSDLPEIELLSMASLALQPSSKLLEEYLQEIEKMRDENRISKTDYHALLLVNNADLITIFDDADDALVKENIPLMLERIKSEYKKEEEARTLDLNSQLDCAKAGFESIKKQNKRIVDNIKRNALKETKNRMTEIKMCLGGLFLILAYLSADADFSYGFVVTFIFSLLSALSLITGFCFISWFDKIKKVLINYYVKKEKKKLGVS